VADHTFTDAIGSDPEGAIVARWDIVDGIWSSEVGIKIVLAPITILSDTNDRFSATTVSGDLLKEVAGYRAGLSAHEGTGLTHLLTGRSMDGNIIGISYLGAVCNGSQAVSLSQSTTSLIMGALIAAHELGHSFNAVHDGVPGSCSTTPQTYLMAPTINFSNQFSACSLQAINVRALTASCLRQIAPVISPAPPPTGGGDSPSITSNSATGSSNGGGGRLDLAWLAFLGGLLILQRARTLLPRHTGTKADEIRIQDPPEHCAHDRGGCARVADSIGPRVASRDRAH
jgi:hypothetical protein